MAQEVFEKTVALEKNKTAEMNFDFADNIIIKSWENSEVSVKATVNINDNADNSKYELNVEPVASGIKMTGKINNLKSLSDHSYQVVDGAITKSDDQCVKIDIDYEVFLPEGTTIALETISGNIELTGFEAPMHIKTISGFIDFSIDPHIKASFETKTITGEVYSDLDLETENKEPDMRVFRGGHIMATLNGGGKSIKLETISGDIYLRKEK
jgi:DUF4097 and DUF4098 domain-containing protein YvlB